MPIQLEPLALPLEVADKGFKAGIAAGVAGVTALVGAMGLAIKSTFKWADDMDSLGDVMGGTNEELAALNFVARKSGVSIDTLSKGTVILEKGLVKANGQLDTTGKALKDWGINVKDASGNLKDQTTLIGEISDKYQTFSTQQEKVNFLTEVFGKSGAELVDFFDTLASEGGIDAVTKKVQELGLAIDPNRYEQFNRNLEEMKLIGLGLAVGFTESVMPALEALSEWVFKTGIPALKNFGGAIGKAFEEGGLLGVADFLLDAFDDIDWSTVSQKIVEGINSIDWTQAGINFASFMDRVEVSLNEAFADFDIMAIGNALASALNNFVAGMFGVEGGEAGLQTIVQEGLANIQLQFMNWINGMPSSFDAMDIAIMAKLTETMNSLKTTIMNGLQVARQSFTTWAAGVIAQVVAWASTMNAQVAAWGASFIAAQIAVLTQFAVTMEAKLRDVAKTFFNAAGKWANQAAQGFLGGMGAILGAVETLVGEINGILKKIITSFTLKIKFGGVTGVEGNSNLGNKPAGGGCFIAGTLITMADRSLRPIEQIQAGDRVLSWDGSRTVQATIVEMFSHPVADAPVLVRINGKLTATPEHLIYASGNWMPAGSLARGAILLGDDVTVDRIERLVGDEPVYNLHTDHDSHNYFANGILVHNGKSATADVLADVPVIGAAGAGADTGRGQAQGVMIMNWGDLDYALLATEITKAMNNR